MNSDSLVSYCLNSGQLYRQSDFTLVLPTPQIVSPRGGPLVALFRHLLSGSEIEIAAKYYTLQRELGNFHRDEVQCVGRLLLFDDDLAIYFHQRLIEPIEKYIGATLSRAYTLASIYPAGCSLDRHTDRAACGWTLSILIGSTVLHGVTDFEKMCFDCHGYEVRVPREPGDALLFNGVETPHWRHPNSNSGTLHTTLLLHFRPV